MRVRWRESEVVRVRWRESEVVRVGGGRVRL